MSGDLVLGVDPGKTGALAIWSPVIGLCDVVDMPEATGAALGSLVRELVHDYEPDAFRLAVVEDVGPMPKQGVRSVWTFAEGHGSVLGALGALSVPVQLVTPTVWKRAMGLSKDKSASRQRAMEKWPEHAGLFARVKDDGRAESALLAWYGHCRTEELR